MLGIDPSPSFVSYEPDCPCNQKHKGAEKHPYQTRRIRLAFRNLAFVQNLDAGGFPGLLYLRHLVLFSERFKNHFLHFGTPEQVGIGDAEDWELANRGVLIVCRRHVFPISFSFAAQLLKLMAKLIDPRLQSSHSHIGGSINLAQSFQFSLGRNQLTLDLGGGADHCLALFLNIDGRILAGKVAEVLFGRFEILLDLPQPLFEEGSFFVGRRNVESDYDSIKAGYIFASHIGGPLRAMIANRYGDDAAFAV